MSAGQVRVVSGKQLTLTTKPPSQKETVWPELGRAHRLLYPEGILSFSPALVRWCAVRKHLRRVVSQNDLPQRGFIN